MNIVYEKIKNIANDAGYSIKKLAETIGMTETGFYAAIRNNSMKLNTLQKVAEILGVPIVVFFDDTANNVSSKPKITEKINSTETNNNNNLNEQFISSLQEQVKFLQEDKKCLQEDKNFLQKELDFFKRIVSQKLDIGDKELAKYRTNEQGSLDSEVCSRFGFVSGGVSEVGVLPSVAAGSVSEVR